MRAQIHYEVTGSTLTELYRAAAKHYQSLMGDPDTLLPHDTTLEVTKVESLPTLSGDERPEILGWRADVTVIAQGNPEK